MTTGRVLGGTVEQTFVTISMLTALGFEPQLKLHINVGLNVGITQQQIVGALIHGIPYVGFPRVLNGLTLLQEVMAERAATDSATSDHSRTKDRP